MTSKTSTAMVIAKCPVVEDTLSSNDQRLLSFFWEMRDTEIPLVVFSLPSFLYGRKILASSPSAGYRHSLNWAQTPSIQPGVSISPMPAPLERASRPWYQEPLDKPQVRRSHSSQVVLADLCFWNVKQKEIGVSTCHWLPPPASPLP